MISIIRLILLVFHVATGLAALMAIAFVAEWFGIGPGQEREYFFYFLVAVYGVWIVLNLTPFGDRFQDLTLNTRQPSPRELEKLNGFVAELERRGGASSVAPFPRPRLRMISDEAPNAMAFGSKSVALTTGLLKGEEDQARAVFAHELGHLVNKDTLYGSMKIAALHPLIVIWDFICRPITRIGGWITAGLMLLLLPLFIVGFLGVLALRVTDFVERMLSQPAEYRADAYSVKLTRDTGLPDFLDFIAPMDVTPVNTFLASYVMSHPPTELRHAKAEAILAELGRNDV